MTEHAMTEHAMTDRPVTVRATTVRRALASDEGFTLMELLVYCLLLAVVLAVIGGLFFNLYRTQSSVSAVTDATTGGQSAANSIQAGIRNSTAFTLVTAPAGQLLVARTVKGDAAATPGCIAWFYSPAGAGSIRTKRFTAVMHGVPTASTLATWTLLDSGIASVGGATIFSRNATDPTLTMDFTAAAGSNPAVEFSSSVVSRVGGTDNSSCFTP
jgi:type II secretory pathway pseudopilin PulG